MLQRMYQEYPAAKKNFVHMLYNEKQVALWHKESDED